MMNTLVRIHRDQRGLVGKFVLVWLLLLALIGVFAADAVSIALTQYRLSDVAVEAAGDGVVQFRIRRDVDDACQAAAITIAALQPDLRLGKNFCLADTETGRVTITLRTTAETFLVGRLDATKHYAAVVRSETNGPSDV